MVSINELDSDELDTVSFIIASRYRVTVVERLKESPATPSKIAKESDMKITHVSRALKSLSSEGIAELAVSDDRQKGRIYRLTDEGAEIADAASEMAT